MFMFLCVLFIIIPAFIDYALLRDLPNAWVMFATLGFWLVVVIAFSISRICKKEQLEKQQELAKEEIMRQQEEQAKRIKEELERVKERNKAERPKNDRFVMREDKNV